MARYYLKILVFATPSHYSTFPFIFSTYTSDLPVTRLSQEQDKQREELELFWPFTRRDREALAGLMSCMRLGALRSLPTDLGTMTSQECHAEGDTAQAPAPSPVLAEAQGPRCPL